MPSSIVAVTRHQRRKRGRIRHAKDRRELQMATSKKNETIDTRGQRHCSIADQLEQTYVKLEKQAAILTGECKQPRGFLNKEAEHVLRFKSASRARKTDQRKRESIEYLEAQNRIINNETGRPECETVMGADFCPGCSVPMRINMHQNTCLGCGYTEVRQAVLTLGTPYAETTRITGMGASGKYTRTKHFKTKIKERVVVHPYNKSSDVYINARRKVMQYLYDKGCRSSCDVDLRLVNKAGCKNKAIAVTLTEELSGVLRPLPTTLDMEMASCLFIAMQHPYTCIENTRNHFLPYNHMLFCIGQRLGWDECGWLYVYFYPMVLKNKVEAFDASYRRICQHPDLQWEFVPSLRLEEARQQQVLRNKQHEMGLDKWSLHDQGRNIYE